MIKTGSWATPLTMRERLRFKGFQRARIERVGFSQIYYCDQRVKRGRLNFVLNKPFLVASVVNIGPNQIMPQYTMILRGHAVLPANVIH